MTHLGTSRGRAHRAIFAALVTSLVCVAPSGCFLMHDRSAADHAEPPPPASDAGSPATVDAGTTPPIDAGPGPVVVWANCIDAVRGHGHVGDMCSFRDTCTTPSGFCRHDEVRCTFGRVEVVPLEGELFDLCFDACQGGSDARACSEIRGCEWFTPSGCGAFSPGALAEPRCTPTRGARCSVDTDCGLGLVCRAFRQSACAALGCDACPGETRFCVPYVSEPNR